MINTPHSGMLHLKDQQARASVDGSIMALRALACGQSPKARRSRLFLMLKLFVDDSGNDAPSPVFVLAGYVATIEQWEAFAVEWQETLDIEDPRPMRKMRMSDAFQSHSKQSVFYGFSQEQISNRIQKFSVIPAKYLRHGVVCVIPKDLYHRYFASQFQHNIFDKPYFLAFFSIMRDMFHLSDAGGHNVEFVFDTHEQDKAVLMREFDRFVSLAPPKIKASIGNSVPDFKSDDEVLPLQAADMLAWHIRRRYFEMQKGVIPKDQINNSTLMKLTESKYEIIREWTEAELAKLLQFIGSRKLNVSQYGAWHARASSANIMF